MKALQFVPVGLFYFMTETKFICETTGNLLEVNQFDNFIEISIDTKFKHIPPLAVHLTIDDSEKLIDELHNFIMKIEGGNK
jgi:hypothetical protein